MRAQVVWLTPRRALAAYAVLFSIFIGWASVRTVLGENPHGRSGQGLALTEIAGALCFAWPQTRTIGLAVLLTVFAIATVVELHLGLWPGRFVFYAASALLVQYLSAARQMD